jgi:CCR4-NOT transcription complex subunit 1
MTSFASPLFWQIRYLVTNLNKKNFKSSVAELNQLIDLYGQDSRLFLIQCLVEETDFRDQRAHHQHKDYQKILLLAHEISQATAKPNFASIICQVLESQATGSRARSSGHQRVVTEDFLIQFCRALKLTLPQQITIAAGLCESLDAAVVAEAVKFLKAKLPELSNSGAGKLTPEALHTLAYVMQIREEFMSVPAETAAFLKTIKATQLTTPEDISVDMIPLMINELSASDCGEFKGPDGLTALAKEVVKGNCTLSELMEDIGYQCTTNIQTMNELLEECDLQSINESEIARVLGMLARTHTGLDDELSSVLAGSFLPMTLGDNIKDDGEDGAVATGWNVPVLSQVLASRFSSLDWQNVAKELDHDGFHLPDQRALNIVLTCYRAASKQPFPIGVLFSKWNNTVGQLSFLNQAIAAPADMLSFSTSPRTQRPFDATSISQGSTNQAWLSLDLFSTLLTLAETEHYAAVKGIFAKPARICPELLLSGLAQCACTWDSMRNELFDELLLNYTSHKPHKHTPALMQRLWQCNREVVVYACTLSFRRHGFGVSRGTVLDISQELEGGLQAMLACPQKDFVLSVACAAAEKQLLKLEEFLSNELSNQARGNTFVADMIKFVRNNQSQATKQGNPTAAFSLDALSVLLKVLQSAQGQVPPAVLDEIKQVADSCLKSHNELSHPNADDIEEKANSYFQKIYTSEQSIEEVIAMLKRFKNSQELREQEIFACMIHNLFDEYRFFHKYPEKELRITGILFGTLIQHQLVSSITLGIALRYVLEALRKPPGSGSNGKMFRFGMFALEQFKARLGEWPQYCSHIVAIQHLSTNSPELVTEIRTLMANPVAGAGGSDGGAGAAADPSADAAAPTNRQQLMQQQQQAQQEEAAKQAEQEKQAQQQAAAKQQQQQQQQQQTVQQQQMMAAQQQQQQQQAQTTSGLNVNSSIFQGNAPGGNSTGSIGGIGTNQQVHQDQQQQGGGGMMQQMFGSAGGPKLLHQNPQQQNQQLQQRGGAGGDAKGAGAGFGASMNIDTLLGQDEEAPPVPEQGVTDRIHFIINNIAIANMDVKVAELKSFFHEEHAPWLGNYLVVKRISTQPNFHQMYMTFLEKINMPAVEAAALRFSLQNVGKLLRSEKITTSTSERSLLKNLGHWLGLMTVARDRPLLQRDLDLKRLLLQAYESGRLIAVTPFAAKVLEGCKDSKIFKPPNPWTMGLLGTLHEIYDVPELKLNIKFEIEVLCKALKVKLEDLKLPYGPILTKCNSPMKEGNPDFAVKHGSGGGSSNSAPGGSGMGDGDGPGSHDVHSDGAHGGDGDGDGGSFPEGFQEGTVIPNLAAYVSINLSVTLFNQHPHLKRVVPVAVDRAIREIIQPVVERSVTIACITSRELILKDFAMEPDETKMRKAAHLMVSNLAGSLALVTCKEPLRVSMSNHLRSLLQSATQDATLIEQVVQVCSAENLELGCMLIEKAATEKAMRDIDEGLAPALAGRRKHREQTGQPFYDMSIFTSGNRYPQALPEPLRPKPGGLQPQHLLVYEAFHRSWQPMTPPTAGAGTAAAGATPQRGGAVPTAAGAAAAAAAATAGGAAAAPALGQGHGVGGGAFAQAGGGVADLAKAAQGVGGMDLGGGKDGKDVGGAASAFSSTGGLGSGAGSAAPAAPPQPQLTTSQALEKYNGSMQQLEKVVASLPRQPGFSLSSLGADHEIGTILREVRATAQMTQIAHREESTLAFSQKVFKRLYDKSNVRAGEGNSGAQVDTLLLEVLCALLDSLRDACKKIKKELTQWVMYAPTVMNLNEQGSNGGKLHAEVMTALLRVKLLRLNDVDDHLKRMMDGGRNTTGVELAMVVARQSIVSDGVATAAELPGSLDVLTKMVQRAQQGGGNSNLSSQAAAGISHLLDEVKQAASNSLIGASAGVKEKKSGLGGKLKGTGNNSPRPQDPAGLREQVTYLLEHWIRIWSETPGSEKAYASYLSLLQQQGVLKTEDNSERFFRITTELCIESCFNNSKNSEVDSRGRPQLQYGVVDAFSKLVVLLVKYADPVTVNTSAKINLLTRVLSIITRVLLTDYRMHAANSGGSKPEGARSKRFDQRAYYRLFVNLLQDLNAPDPVLDASNFQVLTAFANCFHSLQPLFVPGFGFAWLELISHRMFMPNLLIAKQHKGWPPLQRLLVDLFRFLEPYLRTAELNDAARLLYKGALRVLLVLLHDFPEFLCDYHFAFCDVISPSCIQLRNLVLSAFPRNMRLPDPFTPNLKVDLLPEITQPPRLLSNHTAALTHNNLRASTDQYLKSRQPVGLLHELRTKLLLPAGEVAAAGTKYNVPTINALVLYVGTQAITQLQNKTGLNITHSAPMDIFQHMSTDLDAEGRYLFLNAIANHLRYPNNHTHYFSCVLLYIFAEAQQEIVKEQITRVLLERLIVHRPHPWGLLITFIELIKNPRYNFWSHGFTHCAVEIERLFESVARSCMSPGGGASMGGAATAAAAAGTGAKEGAAAGSEAASGTDSRDGK